MKFLIDQISTTKDSRASPPLLDFTVLTLKLNTNDMTNLQDKLNEVMSHEINDKPTTCDTDDIL